MHAKLFGITWNLLPLLIFAWALVAFAIVSALIVSMYSDNVWACGFSFLLILVWAYVTSQVAGNLNGK